MGETEMIDEEGAAHNQRPPESFLKNTVITVITVRSSEYAPRQFRKGNNEDVQTVDPDCNHGHYSQAARQLAKRNRLRKNYPTFHTN